MYQIVNSVEERLRNHTRGLKTALQEQTLNFPLISDYLTHFQREYGKAPTLCKMFLNQINDDDLTQTIVRTKDNHLWAKLYFVRARIYYISREDQYFTSTLDTAFDLDPDVQMPGDFDIHLAYYYEAQNDFTKAYRFYRQYYEAGLYNNFEFPDQLKEYLRQKLSKYSAYATSAQNSPPRLFTTTTLSPKRTRAMNGDENSNSKRKKIAPTDPKSNDCKAAAAKLRPIR